MADKREAVVLVHGLWMKGLVMGYLQWHLRRCGYRVYRFSYSSVLRLGADNVKRFETFLSRLNEDTVHLVGHSLGGRVILGVLDAYPEQTPGRIVLLATPLKAACVAVSLACSRPGRAILGKSRDDLTTAVSIPPGREVGMIAGTRSLGLGRVMADLPQPNDGAVAEEETRVPGLADHLTLHLAHSEMLFSSEAAEQVCQFLKRGHFER